jgi:hypothetical protein
MRLASYNPTSGRLQQGYSATIRVAFARPDFRADVTVGIKIIQRLQSAACLLNASRCGRTHCRYTGPYYLAMIAAVLVLALGFVSVGFYGWLGLAVLILVGSKFIWWATERAWGKFS